MDNTLEDFFQSPQTIEKKNRQEKTLKRKKVSQTSKSKRQKRDPYSLEPSKEPFFSKSPQVSNAFIVGVGYDGANETAFLKLYHPKEKMIYRWNDNSDHKPYCFAKIPKKDLEKMDTLAKHPGLLRIETAKKIDALHDKEINISKIIARDPLSIGGKPIGSIRDLIKAWEADIRYVQSYIYDREIIPGMQYSIRGTDLIKSWTTLSSIQQLSFDKQSNDKQYQELIKYWMTLLESPVPTYLRAAVDIEVYSELSRIPDPNEASQPIICACVVGSNNKQIALILKRKQTKEGTTNLPNKLQCKYFSNEKDLIEELFLIFHSYPLILTFNGDDFDLKYLYNRALKLNIPKNNIPITQSRDASSLENGIHIDLFRFFFNRAIQIYAFSQKYRGNTLNEVGNALIETGKLDLSKSISELTYSELIAYCYRDTEITFSLSSFNNDLVMNLITILSRISCLSIEDVTRQGVSNWIKSMLYQQHRKKEILIPRSDEIQEIKGFTTTQAIIKGKKYKGAIVVQPVPGIHFKVAVLDFASLYPSIIKLWNLGYATVNCLHDEDNCKNNKVPTTPLWVCKKNKALESLLIGSLRDLRVKWYKPRSKDTTISESKRVLYTVIQNALKVILNASYGVFGAEAFSLYCPPVAEATAAVGRYIITESIKKAQQLNVQVIYGDTDSIFLGNPSANQLNDLMEWSQRKLGIELEIDKEYRYAALSSRKKNYLGVLTDGTVDIKGLTGKKRHVPPFIKSAFYDMIKILSKVETRKEFEQARDFIQDLVKKNFIRLRNREYSLEELAFSVMMSKTIQRYQKTTPQHVKAARLLENNGYDVGPGDIISFVKVNGEPSVKPCQLAKVSEIDTKKYTEYMSSTFEQVLDALGMNFDEIIGYKKLESFFS